MITRDEARGIAASYIARLAGDELPCEILDSQTLERSYGWVFFYQSRHYIETGDPTYLLAGNAPLIVDRLTGKVTETGTAHPTEYYLARHEAAIGAGAA